MKKKLLLCMMIFLMVMVQLQSGLVYARGTDGRFGGNTNGTKPGAVTKRSRTTESKSMKERMKICREQRENE